MYFLGLFLCPSTNVLLLLLNVLILDTVINNWYATLEQDLEQDLKKDLYQNISADMDIRSATLPCLET